MERLNIATSLFESGVTEDGTYVLPPSIPLDDPVIELLHRYEIRNVELGLTIYYHLANRALVRDTATRARQAGINIVSLHQPCRPGILGYLAHADERMRRAFVEEMKGALDALQPLGAKYMCVHLGPVDKDTPGLPCSLDSARRSLDDLVKHVQSAGNRIKFAVENISTRGQIRVLGEFLEGTDPEHVAFNPCTGLCYLFGDDPAVALRPMVRRCIGIHLTDSSNRTGTHHLIPGEGEIDWHAMGKCLNEEGFGGMYTYEIVPRPLTRPWDEMLERIVRHYQTMTEKPASEHSQ